MFYVNSDTLSYLPVEFLTILLEVHPALGEYTHRGTFFFAHGSALQMHPGVCLMHKLQRVWKDQSHVQDISLSKGTTFPLGECLMTKYQFSLPAVPQILPLTL